MVTKLNKPFIIIDEISGQDEGVKEIKKNKSRSKAQVGDIVCIKKERKKLFTQYGETKFVVKRLIRNAPPRGNYWQTVTITYELENTIDKTIIKVPSYYFYKIFNKKQILTDTDY